MPVNIWPTEPQQEQPETQSLSQDMPETEVVAMDEIGFAQEELWEAIGGLGSSHTVLKEDMGSLCLSHTALKEDIGNLRSSQDALEKTVAGLAIDKDELRGAIGKVQLIQGAIQGNIGNILALLGDITKGQKRLRWAVGILGVALLVVAALITYLFVMPQEEPLPVVEPAVSTGLAAQGFDIWPDVVGWAQIIDTAVHVCPEGCVYDTIQAAVDAASSGDAILIHAGAGRYVEDLTIDKNLSFYAVWQEGADTLLFSPARVIIEGTVTLTPSDSQNMVWDGIEVLASGAGTTFAVKVNGTNNPNFYLRQCYIYASDSSGTGADTVKALWLNGAVNAWIVGGTEIFGDTDGAGQDAYGVLLSHASARARPRYSGISGDGAAAGTGYGLGTDATSGLIIVYAGAHGNDHSDYYMDCPSGATKCYLFGMVGTEVPLVEEGAIVAADGWAGELLAPEEFYAQRNVKAKDGDYTLPVWETRTLYTNEDAAGDVTFTLPGAVAGVEYCFFTYEAQNLYVDPAAGDQIYHLTDAAGDRIQNATIGDSICLIGADTTYWLPLQEVGTWSDAN